MDVIKYPDELLRLKSEEVKLPLSEEDKKLLNELFSYVKEHKDTAVGLSAIQVGIPKRMCAIRRMDDNNNFVYKLVNPRIIYHSSETAVMPEGCLSVPEEHEEGIKRWKTVKVMGYDAITNKNVVITASGFNARILQHEIDHMDGKLFIDYIQDNEK